MRKRGEKCASLLSGQSLCVRDVGLGFSKCKEKKAKTSGDNEAFSFLTYRGTHRLPLSHKSARQEKQIHTMEEKILLKKKAHAMAGKILASHQRRVHELAGKILASEKNLLHLQEKFIHRKTRSITYLKGRHIRCKIIHASTQEIDSSAGRKYSRVQKKDVRTGREDSRVGRTGPRRQKRIMRWQ